MEELDQNILAILGDRPPRSLGQYLPSWKVGVSAMAMLAVMLMAAFLISSKGVRWFTGDDGSSSTLFLKIAPPAPASAIAAAIPASPDEGEDASPKLADTVAAEPVSVVSSRSSNHERDTNHRVETRSRRHEDRRIVPARRGVSSSTTDQHSQSARGRQPVAAASVPATIKTQPPANAVAPAPAPAPAAAATRSAAADQHRSAVEAYRKQVAETQAALAAYDSDRSAYRDELARTQRTQQEYGKKPHSDR